jgi:predicted DNA-binding transcriptional regulator AlpA
MTTMNDEPFTSEQTLELAVSSKVSMPESTKLSLDNLFEALDVMATITSVPEEDRGRTRSGGIRADLQCLRRSGQAPDDRCPPRIHPEIGMTQPTPKIIRLPEVRRVSGLSTTSIYRLMSQDKFPRQRLIGVGAVVGSPPKSSSGYPRARRFRRNFRWLLWGRHAPPLFQNARFFA